MKKNVLSILATVSMMMTISCGDSSSKSGSLTATEQQKVSTFIENLYDKYVYVNDGKFHDFSEISDHFSDKVLNRLMNEFCYDDNGYDGGVGYAVWLFRSGVQDGPDQICSVDKITFEKDNWCTVYLTDMGFSDKTRFHFDIHDGQVYILDFEK